MAAFDGLRTFDPQIAAMIGLNEAIALQQLHFLLEQKRKEPQKNQRFLIGGRWWVYNSANEWQSDHFPFWSAPTIRRTFDPLRTMGLVLAEHHGPANKSLWYSLDYGALAQSGIVANKNTLRFSCDQDGHAEGKRHDHFDHANSIWPTQIDYTADIGMIILPMRHDQNDHTKTGGVINMTTPRDQNDHAQYTERTRDTKGTEKTTETPAEIGKATPALPPGPDPSPASADSSFSLSGVPDGAGMSVIDAWFAFGLDIEAASPGDYKLYIQPARLVDFVAAVNGDKARLTLVTAHDNCLGWYQRQRMLFESKLSKLLGIPINLQLMTPAEAREYPTSA